MSETAIASSLDAGSIPAASTKRKRKRYKVDVTLSMMKDHESPSWLRYKETLRAAERRLGVCLCLSVHCSAYRKAPCEIAEVHWNIVASLVKERISSEGASLAATRSPYL